jgi:hypothetical protein
MTARSRRSGERDSKKDDRRVGGAPPAHTAGPVKRPPPARGSAASSTSGQPAPAPAAAARWGWLKTRWGRLIGIAVGVAAIAGAITTVVSLWPKPEPVDHAAITSLQVTGPEQLSSFEPTVTIGARRSGTAAPGPPGPSGPESGTLPGTGSAEPAGFRGTAGPATPAPAVTTGTEQSNSAPATSASETTATEGTSTGPSSPGPGTSAVTIEPSTGTSPSPPPPEAPPIVELSDQLRAQLYEDIRAQEVLRRFVLPQIAPVPPPPPPGQPDAPNSPARAISIVTVDAVDENGDPVPPQEAAEQLAARLSTVRSAFTPEGKDPLGMRVTVNVEIQGLRDQTLLLYWRLIQAGPTPVPGVWAEWVPAAELTASTERDVGFATMWVPLPEEPGPYRAEIIMTQEASNAPLTSQLTEPFGG